jgi:hypothetical protein
MARRSRVLCSQKACTSGSLQKKPGISAFRIGVNDLLMRPSTMSAARVSMLDDIEDDSGPVMADRTLAYVRSAFQTGR